MRFSSSMILLIPNPVAPRSTLTLELPYSNSKFHKLQPPSSCKNVNRSTRSAMNECTESRKRVLRALRRCEAEAEAGSASAPTLQYSQSEGRSKELDLVVFVFLSPKGARWRVKRVRSTRRQREPSASATANANGNAPRLKPSVSTSSTHGTLVPALHSTRTVHSSLQHYVLVHVQCSKRT